jgi:hypothetical protein
VCEVPRTRIRLALEFDPFRKYQVFRQNHISVESPIHLSTIDSLYCHASRNTRTALDQKLTQHNLQCRAPRRFWCLGVAWWRRPALNISLEIQTIKSQLVKNPSSMDDTMLISNSQSDPPGCSETCGSLPSHPGSQSGCLVQCGS